MKKIIIISFLALLCVTAFSQADTTAIFQKADSLYNYANNVFLIEHKYENALELFNESARITRDIESGNNSHYALALYAIGWTFFNMGDYQNSLKYNIQAADIMKKLYGKKSIEQVGILFNLSNVYYELGDYQKALKCNIKMLELGKEILGEDNIKYARILNSVGNFYYFINDNENALKYHMQALEIRGKILGKNNQQYAGSLNNIANAYGSKGDLKLSLKYYLQALKIYKETLGEEHLFYAETLENIGITYENMGDYKKALEYEMQAERIRKIVLGEEHPKYADILSNIGITYEQMGEYQNALKYYTQATEIKKKIYGENHYKYGSSFSNISNIYYAWGDYKNALKYYNQAYEIIKNTMGEECQACANILTNIGTIYMDMKDYQNAIKYQTKGMEIIKKIYGEKHPNYALTLNNIGNTYNYMGDITKSLKYHTEAMKIYKKNFGNKNIEYARSIYNIGSTYYDIEEYEKSLKYCSKAAIIRKNCLGEEHLDYAQTLGTISDTYYNMNDYTNASKINKQKTDIYKNNLLKNFSFMTAHERETYWNSNYENFYKNIRYMDCMSNDTLATKNAYNTELITKGLLLTSDISMTNIIMESGDSSLISEYETMKTLHMQRNIELEKTIDERVYNCDSLETEIQKIERHIVESCKAFGDITRFIKIDWKEVQVSLKDNDVAIEFSSYKKNDTTIYIALVLTKSMEAPVCIKLFKQTEMKNLIHGIEPTKSKNPQNKDDRGANIVSRRMGIYESIGLYEMLWKPLEKYFPGNPRIYFAPSGMLHQIAIEYAPIGNEQLISDKYEMYRVSSTRFLAMDYDTKPLKNSVLYGGVYYDSDTTTMKQESERFTMRSTGEVYMSFASLNKDEARSSLPYLQGTQTEVENIAEEMRGKNISTTLYEGSAANEESFKALSGKKIDVLHIATHGFFLPTDEKLEGDQSLVQSGLLLSGANYAWQNLPIPDGIEDGILTAKEISFMDLRKTDLVVLSACQTALGEITGEGVFGLQRGFKKAGARTIIMSLWPVDDNATLLMMTEFYTNLTKGMSKREAFLAAQNKVKTTAGFENPRYWAAFIMLDGNER